MSERQNQTLRADIQSLRALAVILVVAAHARTPYLTGGYVGVDVFFVLSGYLISGLVLREVGLTKRFDVWKFYANRLKRLLPAMLFVFVCTATIAQFVVSPQQQLINLTAGKSATVWLSNFYFSSLAVDYFSVEENRNIFLHSWSLAVEEQFYLIWPWLLLYLYGFWKWQKLHFNHERLAYGLMLAAAASILLGCFLAYSQPEDGFYMMPSRGWEFSLGALSHLITQAMEQRRFKQLAQLRGRSILNTIGWLAILLAAMTYSADLRYPGLWALLPCLGTIFVLIDTPEEQPNSLISRLMLYQPHLQFIGNISYSFYLWHWPVLLLGTQLFGVGAPTRMALVGLSIGLATATHFMLEKPIHHASIENSFKVFIPSLLGMAVGFLIMCGWQIEVDKNLNSSEQKEIRAAKFDLPHLYSLDCDTWYHSAELAACVYGSEAAKHTVVMFGDSVLAQWFPAVSEIYLNKPDWRLIVLTKSACPASQVSFYYGRIKANYDVCDLWRQRALSYMKQLHPDIIIMGSTRYDFTSSQWITGTRAVLDYLSPAAKSVVIMAPTPELGFDSLDCLSKEANLPHWSSQYGHCETKRNHSSDQNEFKALALAAQPYPNVLVIDLSDSICPDGLCQARFPTGIRFRDTKHLTASFIQSLAPVFAHALKPVTDLQ